MAASRYGQALALLCAACLLLAGAASGGRVDVEDMLMMDRFRAWQATYNRSYVTAAERLRRFEVYRQNMELIEATNRRGLSYTLGEGPFTDLTSEEFLATHTMPRLRAPEAAARHRELITTRAGPVSDGGRRHWNWNHTTEDLDVPKSVDWRTKGVVTPVKDQDQCGSCWAFAAVATIEGLHKMKTGQLVSLSEQELVDCVYPPSYDVCYEGGNPALGMDWVAGNGGITTESDYPYKKVQGTCKLDKTRNHVAKIGGSQLVDQNNEAALEAAVAQQPVAVVVYAEPIKQHYNGGVFHGPCDGKTDHAVTVVGYGAEPGGRKYWIVKNSWGESWGEKGYFRIERRIKDAKGTCGIATYANYPVM